MSVNIYAIVFISKEKKAISEADIKADINKRNNANTKATTGPVARVCIPISLKNSDKK